MRKLLLSVLLIACGLGALHLAIGFENFASDDETIGGEPIRRTRDERGIGGGITVSAGDGDVPEIAVSGSGRFRLDRLEPYDLPGGVLKRIPVYSLVAGDSEFVAEDLLRLDDVTVRLFRVEPTPEPHGVHVGTITARQAFIQVGRGEDGRPSIREDREMDLRDVVLESTAESRVQNLHLEVARLLVVHGDRGVDFRTPTPDEPFSLTLGGTDPTALSGLGVRGLLPADMADQGAVLEVHVSKQPVLVRGSMRARSDGPLDYVEDVSGGIGTFEMVDDVVLEGLPQGAGQSDAQARGDRLVGRLLRFQSSHHQPSAARPQRAEWLGVRLDGAPARLLSGDIDLRCRSLLVRPGFDGAAATFAAIGAPELTVPADTTSDAPDGAKLRFTAADRIHLIELPRLFEGLHAPFGFGNVRYGSLVDQLVVFEGASSLTDPEQGLHIDAAQGLRLLRSGGSAGISMVSGAGDVHVQGDGLELAGNDGFLLRQTGERRIVRLGPEVVDASHHYSLRHELEDGLLTVEGSGACELSREGSGAVFLALDSPAEDVVLRRGTDSLSAVAGLDAWLSPAGELDEFHAEGSACRLETTVPARGERLEQQVVAVARSIHSAGGANFDFTGDATVPAKIDLANGSFVAGRTVEVYLGSSSPLVIARTDAAARVPVEDSGTTVAVELHAEVLRLLPGLVPEAVLALHGMPAVPVPAAGADLLIATGDVEVVALDASDRPTGTATGEELVFRVADGAGMLRGAPAIVDSTGPDGRRFVARARRIRFGGGEAGPQRVVLLPEDGVGPELDVYQPDPRATFGSLRIASPTAIVGDASGVTIAGPAAVRGLTADGFVDPDGVRLDADTLRMTWHGESHEVEQVVASGNAELVHRGLRAYGDEMRIDVPATLLEVERKAGGSAGVSLRGVPVAGELFVVDYEAQELRAWSGRSRRD